ncbi:uncharacterized protein LOC141651913 [Silene latifolia]|uniref:uncharacterized protein LOC141651913 n=1 Tax=Silene latifolia TaxID=37657 RepID=UPI003D787F4F
MFIYGEPALAYRCAVWEQISEVISGCSPLVIIGDFNQVELHCDKFGGSPTIRGQDEFLACKLNNDLIDVPFFGPRFTWTNSQLNADCIFESLDRAYATQDWFQIFPHASLLHLPILISDHAPIILRFFQPATPFKRPYRVDNWCLSIPEVMNLVNIAWNGPVAGSSMYVLSRKLASARYAILSWVLQHRISHGINWSSVDSELDSSSDSIVNSFTANAFQTVRTEQMQRIHKQHQYWLQRVKLRKEILDRLPTRFLFNIVKQRSSKQRILALRASDGTWLHNLDEIETEIVGYFKSLLGPPKSNDPAFPRDNYDAFLNPLDLPFLTPQDCSILSAPFTDMEVLRALRNMEGSKSPGPDGITPRFFQVFWPQIGSLVTSATLRFLNTGRHVEKVE